MWERAIRAAVQQRVDPGDGGSFRLFQFQSLLLQLGQLQVRGGQILLRDLIGFVFRFGRAAKVLHHFDILCVELEFPLDEVVVIKRNARSRGQTQLNLFRVPHRGGGVPLSDLPPQLAFSMPRDLLSHSNVIRRLHGRVGRKRGGGDIDWNIGSSSATACG